MRQVYRLLGLARRHGADTTDTACARALEVEVIDVGLIERMLTRGPAGIDTMAPARPATSGAAGDADAAVVAAASRFVRDPGEFRYPAAVMTTTGKKTTRTTKMTPRPSATTTTDPQRPGRIEPSGELKELMRRLKLGRLLDTLPERLDGAKARIHRGDRWGCGASEAVEPF